MKRFFWLCLLACTPAVVAQTLDAPVEYPLVFTGSVSMPAPVRHQQLFIANMLGKTIGYTTSGSMARSATVKMMPGKNYTLTGTVGQTGNLELSFTPPDNMEVYVNNRLANGFTYIAPEPYPAQYATPVSYTCSVRLEFLSSRHHRLPDSPSGLAAGQATSIVEDKPIWYIGLGWTRTGRYAGAVGFRRSSFSDADFFTPAALYCDPVDTSEITVIRASNVLRQIFAREILIDIQATSTTSYILRIYPRAQVGSLNGNLYTLSGEPFVTYTVSKITTSGSTGVRIDRSEDGQTTWTSLEQVGQSMIHRDWRRASVTSSNDAYTYTLFTSTTTATVSRTGPRADGAGLETPFSWSKTYFDYAGSDSTWGKELVKKHLGNASEAIPLVTKYDYYNTGDSSGAYWRRLKSQINPDGSWVKNLYFGSNSTTGAAGFLQRVYEPWLDGPASIDLASTSTCKYTDWTYQNVSSLGGWKPSTVETHAAGGATISMTKWTYASSGMLNNRVTWASTRDDYISSGEKLTTISRTISATDYNSYYSGRTVAHSYPNGRKDS